MVGWIATGALALGAGAALLAAYGWLSARHFRVRSARPELTRVVCADGGMLAVYRRRPALRRFSEPVLLCHGIATNHLNVDFDPPYSLAHVLADAGFEVFSVDWRGTGPSRPPPGTGRFDYCVDQHIRFDGPALVSHACQVTGATQVYWVGHSMGALVGYGVAQGPEGARIKGLCALGAPVFFAYRPWLRQTVRLMTWLAFPYALRQRWLSVLLAPFLGYVTVPLTDTLINPKAIPAPVLRKVYANLVQSMGWRLLRQFKDWIWNDAFRSEDLSVDYRAGLAGLTLPALVIGGSQDQLASSRAVQQQFDLLGSPDKTLMVFGRENGDGLDYGHGDLIFGAGAPVEIYPRLQKWLTDRATLLAKALPSASGKAASIEGQLENTGLLPPAKG